MCVEEILFWVCLSLNTAHCHQERLSSLLESTGMFDRKSKEQLVSNSPLFVLYMGDLALVATVEC